MSILEICDSLGEYASFNYFIESLFDEDFARFDHILRRIIATNIQNFRFEDRERPGEPNMDSARQLLRYEVEKKYIFILNKFLIEFDVLNLNFLHFF